MRRGPRPRRRRPGPAPQGQSSASGTVSGRARDGALGLGAAGPGRPRSEPRGGGEGGAGGRMPAPFPVPDPPPSVWTRAHQTGRARPLRPPPLLPLRVCRRPLSEGTRRAGPSAAHGKVGGELRRRGFLLGRDPSPALPLGTSTVNAVAAVSPWPPLRVPARVPSSPASPGGGLEGFNVSGPPGHGWVLERPGALSASPCLLSELGQNQTNLVTTLSGGSLGSCVDEERS